MPRFFSILLGITAVTAVFVMVGWVFGIDVLTRIAPGLPSMKFTTALSFLLSACLLFFLAQREEVGEVTPWGSIVIPTISLTLLLLMGTSFLSFFFNFRTGIEYFFVPDLADTGVFIPPGTPSIGTMLAFTSIATFGIIGMTDVRWRLWVYRVLAMLTGILGAVAVIGFILGIPLLYYTLDRVSSGMSLHTAILFVFVGVAQWVFVRHGASVPSS